MPTNVDAQICVRRDTASNWTSSNPILLNGEVGYDTTNNKIKIGNGSSTWTALSYLTDATGGGWPDTAKSLWQTDFAGVIPTFPLGVANSRAGAGPEYYYGSPSGQAAGLVNVNADWYPEEYSNGIVTFSVTGTNSKGYLGEYAPTDWFNPYRQCPAVTAQWQNHELVAIFKTGFSLSSYILCVGATNNDFSDAYDHTVKHGFYFRYQPGNNGGRWMCYYSTLDYNTFTTVDHWVDSGVTVQAYTSYNLKIVTTAGTGGSVIPTVQFYINGALVASPNLAALPANETTVWTQMQHTILLKNQASMGASSSSNLHVDYMHHLVTFPQGRTSWVVGGGEA